MTDQKGKDNSKGKNKGKSTSFNWGYAGA